jgi:hypothetical protein
LSLIVADFVQNLRAALDHLLCGGEGERRRADIRQRLPDPGQGPRELWPVAKALDRQVSGISEEAEALIRYAKPFRLDDDADRHPLACLQALSNEDKHRVVLRTATAVPHPELAAPVLDFDLHDIAEFETFELHAMKPLKAGDVLMEAAVEITGPLPHIRFKGELPVEVAFGEMMIPASELIKMFDRVDLLVIHLSNELLGAQVSLEPLEARLSKADSPAACRRVGRGRPGQIGVHALPNLIMAARQQVPVDVEGRLDLRVPQELLNGLGIRSGVD